MNTPQSPPSLRQWQETMTGVCDGSHSIKTSELNNYLDDAQGITNAKRLQVYRNNYLGARLNVLEQTFPRLVALLGSNYLRQCGRRYLNALSQQQESCVTVVDLNRVGEQFPLFLKHLQNEQKELESYLWLADLAQLDYHLHCSYYATDSNAFDFERFQQHIDHTEPLYLLLNPSVSQLICQWPIADIFNDINNHQIQEYYPFEKQRLCIYRQAMKPEWSQLSNGQSKLLSGLLKGLSMQQLVERYADTQKTLPLFIQRGWVCGFTTRASIVTKTSQQLDRQALKQQVHGNV